MLFLLRSCRQGLVFEDEYLRGYRRGNRSASQLIHSRMLRTGNFLEEIEKGRKPQLHHLTILIRVLVASDEREVHWEGTSLLN